MLTWIILRAAGIGAYLMLWATVSWGLIGTASLSGKRVARATAINVHQFLATTAFVLLAVHIGGLLLDSFVPFKPVDVLVPLHTTYQTLPVALGIVSMYALAIVLFSSWLRKHLSTKVWRALHLLAIPTFGLALVHGVFAGTDTVRPWMWWGYVITGGSVLFFTLARALTIGIRPTRAPAPAHATAARTRVAPAAETAVPDGARQRMVPAARAREFATVGSSAAGPSVPPREDGPGADGPPTVVVRLELVIEGDQQHGLRRVDVPVRLHGGTHARDHRQVRTERLTAAPHIELGPGRPDGDDPPT